MPPENRLDDLTAREREVLDLVRLGLTNEEIAGRLGITEAGAKYHVSQILSKLSVTTREEAAGVAAVVALGVLWTSGRNQSEPSVSKPSCATDVLPASVWVIGGAVCWGHVEGESYLVIEGETRFMKCRSEHLTIPFTETVSPRAIPFMLPRPEPPAGWYEAGYDVTIHAFDDAGEEITAKGFGSEVSQECP